MSWRARMWAIWRRCRVWRSGHRELWMRFARRWRGAPAAERRGLSCLAQEFKAEERSRIFYDFDYHQHECVGVMSGGRSGVLELDYARSHIRYCQEAWPGEQG